MLKRIFYIILIAVPLIGAAMWSLGSLIRTVHATVVCSTGKFVDLKKVESSDQLSLRRGLQRCLSDHDVYIPLEDIRWNDNGRLTSFDSSWTMQIQCDRARLHVWVPLRFKLPVIGEKVIEWCWIPQTRAA
jgi:hypothetical protein